MHFPIIAILGIALLSCVRAAAPPRVIEVYYPKGGANLGQNVSIGYGYTEKTSYRGMNRNESISLMLPNGTTNLLFWTEDGDISAGSCVTRSGKNGAWVTLPVHQVGTYTALWSVRYAMSSNPSKANATYCGPAPFSYQTWVLNATFLVRDMGPNLVGLSETRTTQLPTKPTGSVQKISGAAGRWATAGWAVSLGAVSVALVQMLPL